MASTSQQPKERERALSTLNVLIEGLNLAKEVSSITPAKAAFGSVSALLVMIRDSMTNQRDCVDLGMSCAGVCKTLERGLKGRKLDELSESLVEAIGQLTVTVATIQNKIVKMGKRSTASRLLHAKNDRDTITGWKQDLNRILQIFNTELAINTHMMVVDMHRNAPTGQEGSASQYHSAQPSIPTAEMPPPAPRVCFGRDELVEKVVGLAVNMEPIALIGAGGIGKTSIALTVLHHCRIKEQFGDERRFIRCDKFPPSRTHLLARLSKVIGAGVENPEDLTQLRPVLSSKVIFIIFDNIESIIDPQGKNAQEIYEVVVELCQVPTVCVCITSRTTMVPPLCKRPAIHQLSKKAACDIFYNIYDDGGRSEIISGLVQRLDFHALSVALLATTASHNMWSYDRVAKEWETRRAQVLRTEYNESLAATIELSLTSPTFRKLGSDTRDLLGVVAFFPQGVDENNLDRFFSAIPNRQNIFDKFCALSLAYRNNGFITMLAPIRDYLCPQDPKSSPLLCATRDRYFTWLSGFINPNVPEFRETRWITSEDVNVEYVLDVFTSVDMDSVDVWDACIYFVDHLCWHKPRRTILAPKIEALPDDHRSKPDALLQLSLLSCQLGNHEERRRLLTHTLGLQGRRGDGTSVARTLRELADTNCLLGLCEEGISQARAASEIFEWLGSPIEQAQCLGCLVRLLLADKQLDAAETEASRMIDLIPEKGQEHAACQSHEHLGKIYQSKGEKKKAIHQFEIALGIASRFNWPLTLFWNHYNLALLFRDGGEFDKALAHVEQAKSHAADNPYCLGRITEVHAQIWIQQGRIEDAKAEASRALEIYKELGATEDAEDDEDLLWELEQEEPIGWFNVKRGFCLLCLLIFAVRCLDASYSLFTDDRGTRV